MPHYNSSDSVTADNSANFSRCPLYISEVCKKVVLQTMSLVGIDRFAVAVAVEAVVLAATLSIVKLQLNGGVITAAGETRILDAGLHQNGRAAYCRCPPSARRGTQT